MLKWLVVEQYKNDCNYKYVIFFKCVCLCRGGGGLQQLKYEDMLSFTLGIHFQTSDHTQDTKCLISGS